MIDELLPETSFKRRTDADAVVLLQTAPEDDAVGLEETTASEVYKSIVAASHYEWKEELEGFCRVFDSLFDGWDRLSEHRDLIDSENDVFESSFDRVPVFNERSSGRKRVLGNKQ